MYFNEAAYRLIKRHRDVCVAVAVAGGLAAIGLTLFVNGLEPVDLDKVFKGTVKQLEKTDQ